jgi:hypothetical protein
MVQMIKYRLNKNKINVKTDLKNIDKPQYFKSIGIIMIKKYKIIKNYILKLT